MTIDSAARAQAESPAAQAVRPSGAGRDNGSAVIELRDLRYHLGLAEELHFGRAAARLFITQPGLSQAVARLERVLGVKLFTRTNRKVELTEAGTELAHRARRLLAEHNDVINVVRSVGLGEIATIRLGVALLTEPVVTRALKAFKHEYPRVLLDYCTMFTDRLLEQLQAGELQAAIVPRVPGIDALEDIEWEPLRRTDLALLASRSSRFARAEDVTIAGLEHEKILVHPRALAPGEFEWLKGICREFGGFEPELIETTALATTVPSSEGCPLESGVAIGIMAEATARMAGLAGHAVVPIKPPPHYVVVLAWRRGDRTPQVQRLVDYLRTYRDEHDW